MLIPLSPCKRYQQLKYKILDKIEIEEAKPNTLKVLSTIQTVRAQLAKNKVPLNKRS